MIVNLLAPPRVQRVSLASAIPGVWRAFSSAWAVSFHGALRSWHEQVQLRFLGWPASLSPLEDLLKLFVFRGPGGCSQLGLPAQIREGHALQLLVRQAPGSSPRVGASHRSSPL